LLGCSTVLLPIAAFAETPGTFVNGEGRWQSFDAAANPVGDARPGWRALRVRANLLGVEDAEYHSAEDVLDGVRRAVGEIRAHTSYSGQSAGAGDAVQVALDELDVPIYSVDAVVRRSEPLQRTVFARGAKGGEDVRAEIRVQSAG